MSFAKSAVLLAVAVLASKASANTITIGGFFLSRAARIHSRPGSRLHTGFLPGQPFPHSHVPTALVIMWKVR